MLSTRGVSPITGTGSHAADYVSSLFAAGTPASRGFAAVCVGDWRIKMMMLMGLFIERYRCCWQLQNQTRVTTRKPTRLYYNIHIHIHIHAHVYAPGLTPRVSNLTSLGPGLTAREGWGG